jgi:hypothetical protein
MNSAYDVFYANLRLDEVAVGAECFAARALVFAAERGHHDDFYIFCLGCRAKDI